MARCQPKIKSLNDSRAFFKNHSLKEDGECVLSRSKPVLLILCESLREVLGNMLDETIPHTVKI